MLAIDEFDGLFFNPILLEEMLQALRALKQTPKENKSLQVLYLFFFFFCHFLVFVFCFKCNVFGLSKLLCEKKAFIAIGPFSLLRLTKDEEDMVTTSSKKGKVTSKHVVTSKNLRPKKEEKEEEEEEEGKKEENEEEESKGNVVKVTVRKLKEELEAEEPKVMSPFNVRESFPSPLWSKEEVQNLFELYQQERRITVDAAVIQDIFYRTNG